MISRERERLVGWTSLWVYVFQCVKRLAGRRYSLVICSAGGDADSCPRVIGGLDESGGQSQGSVIRAVNTPPCSTSLVTVPSSARMICRTTANPRPQ